MHASSFSLFSPPHTFGGMEKNYNQTIDIWSDNRLFFEIFEFVSIRLWHVLIDGIFSNINIIDKTWPVIGMIIDNITNRFDGIHIQLPLFFIIIVVGE